MSLKIVHVLFLCACIALAIGFAAWSYSLYGSTQRSGYLVTSVISAIFAPVLGVYGQRFLHKLRGIR